MSEEKNKKVRDENAISRRSFIKGMGTGVVAATVAPTSLVEKAAAQQSIDKLHGVMETTIIRYRSDTPIMEADKPWEEGSFIRPVSVIPEPDGSRLRLYYLLWHRPDFTKNLLCVAYSTDAFNWEKPDLGEGNNIVLRPSRHKILWGVFHPTQVIYDPNDPNEEMRWKCSYWGRPSADHYDGICLAASTDGLKFRDIHGRPIATNQNDGMCLIDVRAPSPVTWLKSK